MASLVTLLDAPLLPCGRVPQNRIGKAALSDALAEPSYRLPVQLQTLYNHWSVGGYGLPLVRSSKSLLERPSTPGELTS
jgi:hypothetical protein